ncbi:unnamed protein product (macronuclear) [Paramecium tetraurelia]|uniref:Uncharacterized protein n=1 Tax=Paramecium tetraurelia TaxID=5888 RepID=A0BN35_PARTE|nr:uncharacterized protein GSPATT00030590001 [Paramecium tetraurelia]CAK59952.1 unnamed protein product [Paramecium tetraurelia]|eukprot:XP_001427350.1 hypothetical protein (macronuclear) [Paramecium tetraurelia strain d4-2]
MDKTEADYLKRAKVYPCYAIFYEAAYACTVIHMFDFLMELEYTRRSNRTFEYNHFQHEMRRPSTIYDSLKMQKELKRHSDLLSKQNKIIRKLCNFGQKTQQEICQTYFLSIGLGKSNLMIIIYIVGSINKFIIICLKIFLFCFNIIIFSKHFIPESVNYVPKLFQGIFIPILQMSLYSTISLNQ